MRSGMTGMSHGRAYRNLASVAKSTVRVLAPLFVKSPGSFSFLWQSFRSLISGMYWEFVGIEKEDFMMFHHNFKLHLSWGNLRPLLKISGNSRNSVVSHSVASVLTSSFPTLFLTQSYLGVERRIWNVYCPSNRKSAVREQCFGKSHPRIFSYPTMSCLVTFLQCTTLHWRLENPQPDSVSSNK